MQTSRMKIVSVLALVAMLCAGTALVARAQPGPDTNQVPDGQGLIPAPQEEPSLEGKITDAGNNLIDVTVENETLENVVKLFTINSRANIVTTSAQLDGTVTVNLHAVEWKAALSSILDVHNLALVEKLPGSGVYSIIPKPTQTSEPLVLDTIFLHFTTVPELSPIVSSMLAAVTNASVSQLSSRNAMIVRTTEANMREIKTLVAAMDVPGRQVVVEANFMEISDSASKKLGIKWESLGGEGFALTAVPGRLGGAAGYDKYRTRSSVLTGTESTSRSLSESTGESSSMSDPDGPGGVEPTLTSGSTRDKSTTYDESSGNDKNTTRETTIEEFRSAILDFSDFRVVLNALKQTEGVTLVSNPKMIVASGSKDASFEVGEREPIVRITVEKGTQDSPGDTVTSQLDTSINTPYIKQGYLETGIQLKVVPVVKTDDLIEAFIEPRLIVNTQNDKIVGEGDLANRWPRLRVKEIKTTFTLRSGQTVAIGGLTDSEDGKSVSKIPLLGDIPLIGKYLFSHTFDNKRQKEIVIFVTLTLAEPEALFQEAGIPDQAQLIHKRLIQNRGKREDFEHELDTMKQAAEKESAEKAKKWSKSE